MDSRVNDWCLYKKKKKKKRDLDIERHKEKAIEAKIRVVLS